MLPLQKRKNEFILEKYLYLVMKAIFHICNSARGSRYRKMYINQNSAYSTRKEIQRMLDLTSERGS